MPEVVHSVSDITADIRGSLEERFHGIWVEGEVSNHRQPGSGHHYFTLKDSFAQISCVLFRGAARKNALQLRDGMQVKVFGDVSVYEARGQYQVIVQIAQPTGHGDLQARFEALKRKLDAEGVFAPERKRPLPAFPIRIGIVTSPTGAAIRDVLNVLRRRAPWLKILIHPARVQGEGAAGEIAAGIECLTKSAELPRPDLVLVTRGGGSIEDLWAFNEEIVARAIAACPVPVISGVGHEIDFTIADFAADRREPTPSAAAENLAPDRLTLLQRLGALESSLEVRIENDLGRRRRELAGVERQLRAHEPGRKLQSWAQSLDHLGEKLESLTAARLQEWRRDLERVGGALSAIEPARELHYARERVVAASERLEEKRERLLREKRQMTSRLGELLESLSPDATIRRGYSLTTDEEGNLITSAGDVREGQRLRTCLADGEIESVVSE